ncbi:hypothetical protein CPB84DRAFT_1795078 [Gymnopilus junonius]|uniref:MYND-type domain-containing protein n=1 Tax=Gymnopilus junonius TaxID=109634 RepID=A0A9P5NAN3_GYMJU|nr:hypothetical protein CPB84DRAFT_1795078 [Gymnopilus junonius]
MESNIFIPEQLAEAKRLAPLFQLNYQTTCAATVMFQTRLCRRNKTIMDTRAMFLKDMGTLGPEAYLPRRKVVEWMDSNSNGEGERKGAWLMAMYVYEIVKASSKRERDWGHLVFTDAFVDRCLLVMVFPSPSDASGFSHEDYAKLTKWHAHRFMAMCMCIFHDDAPVSWVRATYVTEDQLEAPDFRLGKSFLSFNTNPFRDLPPFFTVTPGTVLPCLLASDVFKIDSVRAQDPNLKSNPVPIPQTVRDKVIGDKNTRVSFRGSEWQSRHYCACARCKASKKRDLNLCSRCTIEFYCGKECQKLAWAEHKRWCRAGF